jgi:formylglycine-generating enzyme
MVKIFISYRRHDNPALTKLIYDRLCVAFGEQNVFLDIHNIGPGQHFPKRLAKEVVQSDLVLALIGSKWEGLEPTETRRIAECSDWVRYELELALNLDKAIIPVLLDAIPFPLLPKSIDDLSNLNAKSIRSDASFEHDIDDLIAAIKAEFQEPNASLSPPPSVPPCPPETPLWIKLLIATVGMIIGIVSCFAYFSIFWHEPVPIDSETLEQALVRAENFSGTNNADWIPFSHSFEDGIEMMLVPVGCFQMGGDGEAGYWNTVDSWERGIIDAGYVCFDRSFWIDKTEVTQGDFSRLGGRQAIASAFSGDNLPVEQITWFEAQAFCEARGGRFPSEAEWEYAARGINSLDYPWGEDFDGQRTNFCDSKCSETWANTSVNDGYPTTSPVGTFPLGKSWVGTLDMAGNVWEWTNSIYREYPYDADDGREANTGERGDLRRVLRGGSWYFYSEYLRSASRDNNFPDRNSSNNGFRCVRSASLSPISDLSNYVPFNLVDADLVGSDFAWISDVSEQVEPSLIQTELDNVRGTFVYYPVELRSVRNEDDYSVGTLEGRLQRELRDSERENFHALAASIYIESDEQRQVFVIPYIHSDTIRSIQLGF